LPRSSRSWPLTKSAVIHAPRVHKAMASRPPRSFTLGDGDPFGPLLRSTDRAEAGTASERPISEAAKDQWLRSRGVAGPRTGRFGAKCGRKQAHAAGNPVTRGAKGSLTASGAAAAAGKRAGSNDHKNKGSAKAGCTRKAQWSRDDHVSQRPEHVFRRR
jgi:hypothetical protein